MREDLVSQTAHVENRICLFRVLAELILEVVVLTHLILEVVGSNDSE